MAKVECLVAFVAWLYLHGLQSFDQANSREECCCNAAQPQACDSLARGKGVSLERAGWSAAVLASALTSQ